MRRLRILVPVLLPLVLLGCTRLGQRLGLRDPPMMLLEGGPICPSTAVLSDAVTVTKLKAGAPANAVNPADVVLSAEMSRAELECNYDPERNMLSVDVMFAVRAARGAAATGPDPALDYFVAVVDEAGNVLTKSIFKSEPALRGNATGIYTQNVSNFAIPLAMDKRPIDYQILTGFQLTPAELAYNRIPKTYVQPQPQPQQRRP